jgi:SynChlorMet cassette radical SAM/SPASM protein ScmF
MIHTPRIGTELYNRAIASALSEGLMMVKLTGGEPLLYPDWRQIIQFVAERGVSVALETNGTLLDAEAVEFLCKCYVHVSVSLDGAEPETHDKFRGAAGAFEAVQRAVHLFVEQGRPPQVIFSLYAGNRHELEPLVALMRDWGVEQVKVNIVSSMGRGERFQKKGWLMDVESLLYLKQTEEKVLQQRYGVKVIVDVPCAFDSTIELVTQGVGICPFLNLLSILANGDITFCGLGYARPEWILGNVESHDLVEIWRHHPYLSEIRRLLPQGLRGVCGKCLLRDRCLGKCRAAAMAESGDVTAPFALCHALYEAGLFPLSRLTEVPEDIVVLGR